MIQGVFAGPDDLARSSVSRRPPELRRRLFAGWPGLSALRCSRRSPLATPGLATPAVARGRPASGGSTRPVERVPPFRASHSFRPPPCRSWRQRGERGLPPRVRSGFRRRPRRVATHPVDTPPSVSRITPTTLSRRRGVPCGLTASRTDRLDARPHGPGRCVDPAPSTRDGRMNRLDEPEGPPWPSHPPVVPCFTAPAGNTRGKPLVSRSPVEL